MRQLITRCLHLGLVLVFTHANAQQTIFKQVDVHVQIKTEATLKIDGNFIDSGTSTIDNDGYMEVTGHFIHNAETAGFINRNSTGTLKLKNYDASTFLSGRQTLHLENFIVDNPFNLAVTINLNIENELQFLNGKLFADNQKLSLLNDSPEAIKGFDERKYIVGTLSRAIRSGANYDFPIGTLGYYEPAELSIKNIGTANFIEAKFIQETVPTANLNLDGKPVTGFLDYGYWQFDNSDPNNTQFDIRLTSNGHDNGGTNISRYAVFKRSVANWESEGTHQDIAPNGTLRGPLSARRLDLTGLGGFIIGKIDPTVSTGNLAGSNFEFITAFQNGQQLHVNFKSNHSKPFDVYLIQLAGQVTEHQTVDYIGEHKMVQFETQHLVSGAYFIVIQTGHFIFTRKIFLKA